MLKELKTIVFAAIVCLVCSLLLAGVYSGLKAEQDRNRVVDMKSKVLTAFGVDIDEMSVPQIEEAFSKSVEGRVLDSSGAIVDVPAEKLTEDQVNKRDEKTGLKQFYPVYVYVDPALGKKLYGIHISGPGLWSVIKGYLALEDDFSTIAGLAFYEHLETPGLGGEIEKPAFQDQFVNKTFLEDGKIIRFRILKPGAVVDEHCVHGITAATLTCKGIEAFLNDDFIVYSKYFETLRK